jgi:hypothetical protein
VKIFLPALAIAGLLFSCGGEEKKPAANVAANAASVNHTAGRVPVGSSGLSVNLPPTHRIQEQQGTDFLVYYFAPVDSISNQGEGGIYLGLNPDVSPPSIEYTVRQFNDSLFGKDSLNGKAVTWTEYTTAKYTQRETFIDDGTTRKIHVWCYANNQPELEQLFHLVKSIRQ